MADGNGWVGDTPGFNGDLTAILGSIKAKTLFLASPHDPLHATALRDTLNSYSDGMPPAVATRPQSLWRRLGQALTTPPPVTPLARP
jgi:hypothetical protein